MKLKFSKTIIAFFSLTFILLGCFNLAQAQTSNSVDVFGGQKTVIGEELGLGESDPRIVAANVIRVVLGFLAIIAIGLIIYAGWIWMTAAGNAEQISKAKKILTGAAIGLIIIFSAFAIATFVLGKLMSSTGADNGGGNGGGGLGGGGGTYCSSSNNACVPDSSECNTNETCNSSCRCVPTFGSPCDGEVNTAQCQPDTSLCNSLLTCDPLSCTCQGAPIIENISPRDSSDTPNGAEGNFITITGQFFGWEPGTVTFLGNVAAPEDDKVAPLANTVNSLCVKSWQDNQIIVVVPAGGVDGPIQVARSDGQLDTSDDSRGPQINNFDVNDKTRPGICLVDPAQGPVGINFNVQGISFGSGASDRTVMIGTSTGAVAATNINNWEATSVNATIPAMSAGPNNVFVKVDNESSNELNFLILAEDSPSPLIDWISPLDENSTPNGAPDNFVTIGGRNFGNEPGSVVLLGAPSIADDKIAPLADTVNALCINSWKDNQIIIVVPNGGVDGPIKVVRKDGLVDATNDGQGVLINDFDVNTIVRPGICLANPDQGKFKDKFVLQGNAFDGAAQGVFFGSENNGIQANVVSSWTNTSVEALVPDLASGMTKVFVSVGSLVSNFLDFKIVIDQTTDPVIDYIDPSQGPKGQYITIYGKRFGQYSSTSTVKFIDENSQVLADTSFPEACRDSWWHDTYITVKVPDISAKTWQVKVTNKDNKSSNEEDFKVTTGLPGPGICVLIPHNGPVNQSIAAVGGNLGNQQGTGSARYYNNKNGNSSAWTDQVVTSTVPVGAETGPFKIFKDNFATSSNSLPFTVGSCLGNTSPNNGCEAAEVCCASDTQKSGLCLKADASNPASVASACGGSNLFNSCVFSWSFTTAKDPVKPLTCAGYSNANACLAEVDTCPNSPGQCQTTSDKVVGQCDVAACESLNPACAGGFCSYVSSSNDPNFNKCKLNNSTCDTTRTVSEVVQQCNKVGDKNYWQLPITGSCPLGSYKDKNNFCTLGTINNPEECSTCANGFSCSAGACVLDQQICPKDSTCTNGQCVSQAATCECCCRIEKSAQDCCLGLSCAGTCGSDTNVADGPGGSNIGYGQCTGCTVKINGIVNQAASDAACNCSGHSLKTCNTSGAAGLGICEDSDEPDLPGEIGDPCDADENTQQCDPDNTKCGNNLICKTDSCTCQINPDNDSAAGKSCKNLPVCTEGADSCGVNNGLSCLTQSTDCRCCCTPGDTKVVTPTLTLTCIENKTPCSGANRGLFCGCSADNQCNGGNAEGCGIDTCCRARPVVVPPIEPADGATGVCRNPLISATFDQIMDPASFSSNVIVVGDYGAEQCPAGTTYLTLNEKTGALAKVWDWVKNLFAGKANAVSDKNFCAVTGTVGGYNDGGKSVVTFAPADALAENKIYYVIIKGDADATDGKAEGVLSLYGIGMANNPNPIADKNFNGVNYSGYAWEFTTKKIITHEETDKDGKIKTIIDDDGICRLDSVTINPNNYAFFTAENNVDYKTGNASVNDDNPGPAYDSVDDNDKVFTAFAKTSSGQRIVPISTYSWAWSWASDNNAVAKVDSLTGSSTKVIAQNVQDGKTFVKAEAKITVDSINNPSTKDSVKNAKAAIHVFLCANPWPSVGDPTKWPWKDSANNCSAGLEGSNGCNNNFNFEFYYCRDMAGTGESNKKLDAISAQPVTRGQYDELLKEFYFLRAKNPESNIPALISVSSQDQGSGLGARVYATWASAGNVNGYKLYYGIKSGEYNQSITITNPAINGTLVTGLTNGQTYYFVVTGLFNEQTASSQYSNKLETAYSNELSATPKDITPPGSPDNLTVIAASSQVTLTWSPDASNSDSKDVYRVYYGTAPGVYGAKQDMDNAKTLTVASLTNGVKYYFGVSAIDSSGNESAITTIDAIPN